jgi:hypothetical protein
MIETTGPSDPVMASLDRGEARSMKSGTVLMNHWKVPFFSGTDNRHRRIKCAGKNPRLRGIKEIDPFRFVVDVSGRG